jgi:lipopolysaccharide export system ATP-binding protein
MENCLEAVGLVKHYRRKCVVDDISVTVRKGEVVGLLGPNGAGKTTTFSMILGLVPRDKGRIFLDGREISDLPMYMRARRGLCLLPQEPSAFRKLTVEENLKSIKEAMPRVDGRNGDYKEILEELGLSSLSGAKAYTLSGGERRRLEIARALITRPQYILLDEPFTGIDPLAIQDLQNIIKALRNKGLGLLITDHSVRETLKICDRAYIIDKGKIFREGQPEELIASEDVISQYLGESISLD